MLLQFRKLTRGAIATIIIALVGIAMVIFLVPDANIGQLTGGSTVAEVAGRKITPVQLTRELDLTLRGRRAQGEDITQQEAIEAGLHERLLDSMIARNALYAYAEKVGVSASDAQVADYIREIPGVLNPVSGTFDETAYAQFLSQMRYSRPEFEADVRGDISTQMLMGALVSGVRAPTSYGNLVFAYETETRVVSIAEAPASAVGAIPPPNEAQLQASWEESQEQLRVPEFRTLTLVYARPQDFVVRVEVPEERLREEFAARRASLTSPERRSYVRISAPTQEQANAAAARLISGEDPDAVAAALGLQVTRGNNQARPEVPDARVAEAVFSQARGAVRTVQGQLTPWAVVRVDAVMPAREPNYAEQREEIRLAIANEEAGDLLNEAIRGFEDARASGASIAEAARRAGLTVATISAVERGGRDQSGAPIAALEGHESVLETAFETPEGEASDFMPVQDADVVVAVDRIIPATVRPLAEVREELSRAWVNRERVRRLRELGAELVEAVRGGQSFDAAARARGFAIRIDSRPIDRRGAAESIPSRGLSTQIFAAAEGGVVTDLRVDGAAMLAAQVEAVNRADPAEAPQMVEAMRARLEQTLAQSVGEAVQDEVVARARPRRNERLLNQLYPGAGGDAEGQ